MASPGLEPEHEYRVNPVDVRPLGQVILEDYIKRAEFAAIILFCFGVMAFMFAAWHEMVVLVAAIVFGISMISRYKMPMDYPESSGFPDPSNLHPVTKKPKKAEGIAFFGNQNKNKDEIWFSNDMLRRHVLIFGTTGAGKAQPLDAKVHTPGGWKRMGDIKVGEQVTMPDGSSAPVLAVFPQGQIDVYRVTFDDGRVTEACGDHLWEVHHKHWRGKYKPGESRAGMAKPRVMKTTEISDLMARNKGKFSIRLPNPVEKPQRDLPLDPYVMGALLGDGNFTDSLRFSSVDDEILSRVAQGLPEDVAVVQYESNKPCDYHIATKPEYLKKGRDGKGGYHENVVKRALRGMGLFGKTSESKFIPEAYLEASVAQRIALLQGLMDTDGTADARKTSLSYSTCSKALAEGVQKLVWSLGGIAKIRTKKTSYTHGGEKKEGRLAYAVFIRLPDPKIAFHLSRKLARIGEYQYADSLKIGFDSIEKIGRKESQCIYIGHEDHLYVTDDYVVTHNTECLISIAFNALVQGSGFIYTDGKGDASLYAKIYSLARAMGRDDDFLLISFMTGSRDVEGAQPDKMSNTINPFAFGSSDALTQLLVGLMDDSGGGGGDMWKGRAISLLTGLMIALVSLRDQGRLLLDVEILRDFMQLKYIVALSQNKNPVDNTPIELSPRAAAAIKSYLASLPGFVEKKGADQGSTTLEQHGYLQMQFTKILGSLSDTLGHIFKTPLGEVDLYDVVVNRRILVVLLPALEKSTDELANLGKIVVASLKNMMAATLGSKMEGTKTDVLDRRPTNSPSPYITILDEYGYYAVPGAAVMPAQARSLGFCMIFAGQDMPAFEKASKEEAASIAANCNIKIFMKLEDAERTFEIYSKAVGETDIVKQGGFQAQQNLATNQYMDNMAATVEKRARGTLQELKDLGPGQAHILCNSKLIRATLFYAAPKQLKEYRLNHFVKVRPPQLAELKAWAADYEAMKKRFMECSLDRIEAEAAKAEHQAGLEAVAEVFGNEEFTQKAGLQSAAAVALSNFCSRNAGDVVKAVEEANAQAVAEQQEEKPSERVQAMTAKENTPRTSILSKRPSADRQDDVEFDGSMISIFGRADAVPVDLKKAQQAQIELTKAESASSAKEVTQDVEDVQDIDEDDIVQEENVDIDNVLRFIEENQCDAEESIVSVDETSSIGIKGMQAMEEPDIEKVIERDRADQLYEPNAVLLDEGGTRAAIAKIERKAGASEKGALDTANGVIEQIRAYSTYPDGKGPKPPALKEQESRRMLEKRVQEWQKRGFCANKKGKKGES